MKKNLRFYNHLSGKSSVDENPFWVLFGTAVGFAAGIILTTLILH